MGQSVPVLLAAGPSRGLGKTLEEKRAYLERRLKAIGFRVLPAQGTYFLVADFRCWLLGALR